MIEVAALEDLGHFQNEWLNAHHHFSFGDYMNQNRMGLGPLRVWNDDTIAAQTGFPLHGHRDMEIITFVREGAITHEDNLGNRGRTAAGNIQIMSAGTGIRHSEFNAEDKTTRLFQIWIEPNRKGHPPHWETKLFPRSEDTSGLVLLASGRSQDAALDVPTIHQDAALFGAALGTGQILDHGFKGNRKGYLVTSNGTVTVNGTEVGERAGATIVGELEIKITAIDDAEILLADLP
ncbi:MAG: hypothetical protein CL573_04140 [Alphaproteobacteria bacterium]|nr:hypothetical protein [Alphaproteobacteria bacterium]HCP01735.1 hypothetical protein [Rhodospirillaceae bacterium]